MSLGEGRIALDLCARASELQGVIEGSRVTDRAGASVDTEQGLSRLHERLEALRRASGSLYVVGNGGSAAVASHAVTDFLKVCGLRALVLHDPSLLSCLANDYGYEHAYARALSGLVRPGDMLIAISSSGQSANILNAAAEGQRGGAFVVTLSGFSLDNPLRGLGDVNVWLDSRDYGMVEAGHQFVLHNLADRLALAR
jgi:D-sedoheptulose 7-phosphate isomerase